MPWGSLPEQREGQSSHPKRDEEGSQAMGTRGQLAPRPVGSWAPVLQGQPPMIPQLPQVEG